jgi:hypothetical protein
VLNFIHSLPIVYKDNVFAIFLINEGREQVLFCDERVSLA